jgi:hypothetical protein
MSYIFMVGDEQVWSPALNIGKLYVDMAASLAGNTEFSGISTGLVPMASDFYRIDVDIFAGFVRALLAGSVVRNSTYRELMHGFIVVSLVILDRAGVSVEPLDESQRDLFDAKAEMAKSM